MCNQVTVDNIGVTDAVECVGGRASHSADFPPPPAGANIPSHDSGIKTSGLPNRPRSEVKTTEASGWSLKTKSCLRESEV